MTGSPVVLVVEDDPDLAEVMTMILEQAGYQVDSAHHGLEALAAVDRRMPAVIVLDMLMPVMNGWEFVREFRARHGRDTPIVVSTASEHAQARGAEVAADGVLAKPFEGRALLSEVARLVDHH